MSKLNCKCGWQISSVGYPSVEIGVIVTQNEEDASTDSASTLRDGREIWECSRCGRLAIEFPRGSRQVKWYAPEDGQPGHIMRPSEGKTRE